MKPNTTVRIDADLKKQAMDKGLSLAALLEAAIEKELGMKKCSVCGQLKKEK